MCAKSRYGGGMGVGGFERNGITGVRSVKILSIVLAAMVLAGAAGPARAALSPPSWMPGSPILAGNQVILLWTPVPGAVKYVIYLNAKKVQDSVSIQAIVTAPEDAGNYEFQVAAVDAGGAEGAKSAPGTIRVFKLVPPKGLEGRMVGKVVALHWEPVGGAVLYNVYRSTESGKGFELVESIQDVRWTDSKVQENKKYYYRVTAKDASGKESAPGAEYVMATQAAAAAGSAAKNVVGKKTKAVGSLTDKDFTAAGMVRIHEPYDIEPSPDRSRYYVSSVHTRAVLIMDPNANFIKEFGAGDREKDGNFASPYGIGIGPDGKVYVADSQKNNVQVFSADGVFDKVFATVTRKDWMKMDPKLADVAVDPSGNVYVLEYRHGAVFKYNSQGVELSHFAKRGEGEDDSGFPTFIKVIGNKIYLADGAKGRVFITDQAGKLLQKVGKKGTGVGLLQAMGGFDVSDDLVFLVDRALALVQVYKLSNGEYQFTLANEDNTTPMPLLGPVAISVDGKKQRVYVAQGIINQILAHEMFGTPEEAKGK